MKKRIPAFLLTLAIVLAMAVPACASTVESTYYYSSEWQDEACLSVKLELDQDPIAVQLPWSTTNNLPVIYVPVGTKVQFAFLSGAETFAELGGNYTPLTDTMFEHLWFDSFTRPDGTVLYTDEICELFGISDEYGRIPAILPMTLTQEGLYNLCTDTIPYEAYLYAVAPGGAYSTTILARPNGMENKISAGSVTAQSTVTYQGQQIPLFCVIPGSMNNLNLRLEQDEGAAYVVNTYIAENNGGTLTWLEDYDSYEFSGQEGYYYGWWLYEDFEGVMIYEIIENGVTLQTVALTQDSSTASAGTGQPSAPAPDAPGSYTVQAGDTWSSICTNFYGNNAQRYILMKANGNTSLKAGAVITLPEQLGNATRLPAPVAGAGEKLYTVKLGDTLGSIALAEYGTMSAYKDIFERNADRIKNVNMIYEGQVIVLPAR